MNSARIGMRRAVTPVAACVAVLAIASTAMAWSLRGLWNMTGTTRFLVIDNGEAVVDQTTDFGTGVIKFRKNHTWVMPLQGGTIKGRWRSDGSLTRINYRRLAKLIGFQTGTTLIPSGGTGHVTYLGPDEARVQIALRMAGYLSGDYAQVTMSWDLTGTR